MIIILMLFSLSGFSTTIIIKNPVANDSSDTEKLEQFVKSKYLLAESYMGMQSYSEALKLFMQIDSVMPSNANINYKLGLCIYNISDDKTNAIKCFEKAVANINKNYKSDYSETTAPVVSLLYLAKSYHNEYMFDKAKETFEKYKENVSADDITEINMIDRYISICENGSKLMKSSLNPQIKILSAEFNTENSDRSIMASNDNSVLIYSTVNKNEKTKNADNTTFYLSTLEGQKWAKPMKIDNNFNTISNEYSSKLSLRKKEFFISKNINGKKELYNISYKDGKWTEPIKLGPSVNSKAVESASITPDGNTLYFSSNREGGYGGYDIYVCEKLSDGSWSKPVNLGPQVNTSYDDQSPYISNDAATLYFSSQGHNTMGGYDVFFSTLSDEGLWGDAENIGYPINTPQDDLFYFPSSDESKAFYSSTKDGGQGSEDIYIIYYK